MYPSSQIQRNLVSPFLNPDISTSLWWFKQKLSGRKVKRRNETWGWGKTQLLSYIASLVPKQNNRMKSCREILWYIIVSNATKNNTNIITDFATMNSTVWCRVSFKIDFILFTLQKYFKPKQTVTEHVNLFCYDTTRKQHTGCLLF